MQCKILPFLDGDFLLPYKLNATMDDVKIATKPGYFADLVTSLVFQHVLQQEMDRFAFLSHEMSGITDGRSKRVVDLQCVLISHS